MIFDLEMGREGRKEGEGVGETKRPIKCWMLGVALGTI